MPKKPKTNKQKAQEQYKREMERYKKELSEWRARQREYKRIARLQKSQHERNLRAIMRNARGKGIYDPKGTELTKYRRSRLAKIHKEFGDLLNPRKFFFIAPPKKTRGAVKVRAEGLEYKTTRSGFFIPKENYTVAKLKEDNKRGELYVERSGKTKRGDNKGKRYRSIIPLASLDDLDREKDRIIHLASQHKLDGKHDQLAFIVKENGFEGMSKHTFSRIDQLLDHLERYKKSIAARVQFLRHIDIVKTTSKEWVALQDARPKRKKPSMRRYSYTKKMGGRNKNSLY